MKKYRSLFLVFCLALFNCPTADKHVKTIGSDDQANIESVELRLLEYETRKDQRLLAAAEHDLQQMAKRGEYNKKYRAKVWGLYGMVYFYQGKNDLLNKCFREMENAGKSEEYYFILKARVEKKPDVKLMILNQGLREADEGSRIKLEMAGIYFDLKDYRNAAALYDEVLAGLSREFKAFYQKKRDMAYNFMGKTPDQTNGQGIMGTEILSTGQVIDYLLEQTDFLANITAQKDIFSADLLKKLKDQDYVYNKDIKVNDVCLRKDLAFLLLRILSNQKNDKSLLDKYSKKYLATGRKSPLPDVVTNDYFFDAALVLVEQEIMELPDGKNFFPDKTVSGFELTNMIKKLKTQ